MALLRPLRERDIERALVAKIKDLGGIIRKVKWIGRRSAPDRRAMLRSGGFWVELKAPGLGPTPAQHREHEAMRAAGEDVRVINSIEGVEAIQ